MKKSFTLLSAALLLGGASAFAQATIVDIEPTPGKYFEYVNYASGFNLLCSPADINIGEATASYTSVDDKQESYTMEWYIALNYMNEPLAAVIGPVNGHPESGDEGKYGFAWYYEQTKPGTELVVTLTDVTYNGEYVTKGSYENDNVTVEDGTITIKFAKPTTKLTLTSSKMPTSLYDDMPEGAASLGTLVFSDNIENGAYTSMIMGSHTFGATGGGDDPDPDFRIPTTVSGNTITIDFSGIDFSALAGKNLSTYKVATIMVFGIYNELGQSYPGGANPYQTTITWDNETGVVSIEAVNGENEVYNLNGVKVQASDVNSLPAGIYIINGKKVVKK